MSLNDLFKAKEYKKQLETISARNEYLEAQNKVLSKQSEIKLSLQQMKPLDLEQLIADKQKKLDALIDSKNRETATLENKIKVQENTVGSLTSQILKLTSQITEAKKELVSVNDQLNIESFGLYKPRYSFSNSSTFKAKLADVRADQKVMIKEQTAAIIFNQMTLNDSVSKGRSMQKKNIKQLLRSFNGECEAAINKVTKSNIESIKKRITRSFDQLNKLNESNGVKLTPEYLDSKLDEAHIALEYALKKEEEKEKLREQREREREERKLQREIANERHKYEKDENHFLKAESELNEKINSASNSSEVNDLKQQLKKLQQKLAEVREHKEKLDKREENPTAGYVYIISNIGAFGKNIFKIGVTRRLDPMERIHELGSASVPFPFDVHALIFSDDAYKLESSLHEYFSKNRVNMINKRKEYFHISIDDVKKALEKHKNLTFDFHEVPEAIEFRESQKILEENN